MQSKKKNLIKKDEYDIGDFVEIERSIYTPSRDIKSFWMKGIIVKKILKDEMERKTFWFKHDYDYMVSTKEYKGDYACVEFNDIHGNISTPIENIVSYMGNFGEWWFHEYKSIYQYYLIQLLSNRNVINKCNK